jgi:hypothetical protein
MSGEPSHRSIESSACGVADAYPSIPILPRVYLVSDVRLYRDGLKASLAEQSQLDLLGVGCSEDVLTKIAALQPHVLLLDLGVLNSLAIPRRARKVVPGLRVVAFAVAEGEDNVLACAEGRGSLVTSRRGMDRWKTWSRWFCTRSETSWYVLHGSLASSLAAWQPYPEGRQRRLSIFR